MTDGFTAKVRIEFFPERLNQIIDSPSGVISQRLKQTAEAVLNAAIPLIGTTYSGHHIAGNAQVHPQLLRESGKVEQGSGSAWTVVFNHPAAFIHHNGSKGHTIPKDWEPEKVIGRKGPGAYRFFSKTPVQHRGTTANPFLINAARSLGLNTVEGGVRFGRLRGEKGQFAGFPPSI